MAHRKIRISGGPCNATVELDSHDISTAVRGLTLKMQAGDMPTVTLDALVYTVDDTEVDAEVHVPEETRDLLVRLGWTPPGPDND